MQPSVYLETTIVSYLTARPTRDVTLAAMHEATREWWATARPSFRVFVSELVLEESARGDAEAAERRMSVLRPLDQLDVRPEMLVLAAELSRELQLPPQANADALHIAISAMSGISYLLTWNCRHIANAMFRRPITEVCLRFNCVAPAICTPLELFLETSNAQ